SKPQTGKPKRKIIRTRLVWFGVGFSLTGAAISHLVWKDLLAPRFAFSSDVKQKFDALEGRLVNFFITRPESPSRSGTPLDGEFATKIL
ncbi:uncharacterized protein LOC125469830, partial [Pyrus x bretschneideri]|uniref:uncharacterized protein LOC125469830 n=1 Tax=Pyrus x bretschneideri TaxID=225117 RepID=UPI00202E0D1B